MTVRVKIGSIEKDIADADPNWINEQINRRRDDGVIVCIQVTINQGSVSLILTTSDCPNSGGGSRPPNPQESEILSLWNKLHLNDKNFSGGNLVAFLRQVT